MQKNIPAENTNTNSEDSVDPPGYYSVNQIRSDNYNSFSPNSPYPYPDTNF